MPPRPDVRAHLESMIGQTIYTLTQRKPNMITAVGADEVLVSARQEDQGVPIAEVESAVDQVWAGEEVAVNVDSLGHRSAFVGAVLGTIPGIEVLDDAAPVRVRLAPDDETGASDGAAGRNPAWDYDELILALDLYLRRGQPPATDPDVVALSELLNRLPIHAERPDSERFRNPNGVHMKLGNFRAPDPSYAGVGLTRGGAGVHEVWERFSDDREALAAAVERITATADGSAPVLPPEEDEAEVVEGRTVFRQHRVVERDPTLVRKKKAAVMRRDGRLACEVCDVDFAERYGPLGDGFIECHHTVPLASGLTRRTTLSDLALVCPNCHRMLHRAKEPVTVEALRDIVAVTRRAAPG